MSRAFPSVIAICVVLLISLFFAAAPMAADFSGQWQGSWQSDDLEGGYSGTLAGNFTQNGSALTGTLSMTDTDCGNFSDLPLANGFVIGNNASADVTGYCADLYVAANITVHFTGAIAGEVFSGNYVAYISSTMEGVDSGTFSMTRSALQVIADFTADVTSGSAPLTVNFTNMSQGQYTTFSWIFGDGGTSAQENPSHTYNTAGTYSVSLTVSGAGGTDTKTKTNYINVGQPAQPPVADFSGSPTSDLAPATVDFTDMSSGTVTGWSWTFEEGEPSTSKQQNPSNILFLLPGTYTVTLTVSGPGGSDTETKTAYITVEDPRPMADFAAEPTSGLAPLSVQFTDLSTGNVTSRTWNFGDGQTSTASNPLHIYQNPGTYTVSLTVSGPVPSLPPSNGTKTRAAYITVTTPPPVAKFTATPYHGAAPLDVQFTDQSTGEITGRTWNFGGGTEVEGGLNPKRRYDAIGLYHVTLQVTGPGGTSDASADVLVYQIMYVNKNDGQCGGKSPCRTSLQGAVNDSAQYALIKATQDTYLENVLFSPQQQKMIMFQGGYDTAFDTNPGFTTASQMSLGANATFIAEKLQLQGGAALGASASSEDGILTYSSDASSIDITDRSEGKRSAANAQAGYLAYRDKKSTGGGDIACLSGPEARNALLSAVTRIYRAALGRDPDPNEASEAADHVVAVTQSYGADLGYALWDVASFLFSARVCPSVRCLSENVISSAYYAILGRDASSEEKNHWLVSQAGVNSLLYALTGSLESVNANAALSGIYTADQDRNELCAAFIALLDRLPTPGEIALWAPYLMDDVVAALLDSKEFRDKNPSELEAGLRLLLLEEDARLHAKQ